MLNLKENINQQVEMIKEQNSVHQTDISSASSSGTSNAKGIKLKKDWSSVRDVREGTEGTQVFGTRTLDKKDNVWNHNAWDNVEWDEEQEKSAQDKVRKQASNPMPLEEQEKYHREAAEFWNTFYRHNVNKFFKDRQWLGIEFPELIAATKLNAGPKKIFEIGCGAGNALFPLLTENENPELFIYACDFSSNAIDVVINNKNYDPKKCKAFIWDLTSTEIPEYIKPASLDLVVLIFVMSAIHPQDWNQVVKNVYKMLKPGGLVLFRDYGRYDMAQLRFKEGRMLSDNFYVRGDGTRVYFFTSEEIENLWGTKFIIEQNAIDRRLIVNRHRRLQMYRIWLQGKFRKVDNK